MRAGVVVTYVLRPEAMDEHLRLIQGVFDQLREEQRDDVSYQVLRLEDGVTFVHVSTTASADGPNPLPQLAAFRAFSADLGSRVASPPVPSPAVVVGSHLPAGPDGGTGVS